MFLTIDIGNTNIKAGLFDGDTLVDFIISPDIENIISLIKTKKIDSAAFSSVSQLKTEEFLKHFEINFSLSPYQITSKSKFNLKIEYSTPETLGLDRICSAEGAYKLFDEDKTTPAKNDFIVSVDFGTASTVNVVQANGTFIGGLILPGIQMMFDSLNKNTAQLPLVTETDYLDLVGSNTNSSVASGVINSVTGLLEKVDNDLKINRKAGTVSFYITGGNAEKISQYLTVNFRYVKALVLIGVKEIYKKNSGSNQ